MADRYAALLCSTISGFAPDRTGYCAVLHAGYVPWLTVGVVVITPVVASTVLHTGWAWSAVAAVIQLVCATCATAPHVPAQAMAQVRG